MTLTTTKDAAENALLQGTSLTPPPPCPSDEVQWPDYRTRPARILIRNVFRHDDEFRANDAVESARIDEGPVDAIFTGPEDVCAPDLVFRKLRWGGRFAYVDKDRRQVFHIARQFNKGRGFTLEKSPESFRTGLGLPLLSSRQHYFIARKVYLVPPGEMTDRFTFDVRLVHLKQGGYAVTKQVPTYGHVVQRLRQRFPKAKLEDMVKRAHKLVDHVFPVFLTREAAFLGLLQRDLPPEYACRVPKPLGVEKGQDGLVRKLYMSWLRLGGPVLSQIEFAKQSADMLRVLHDGPGIMHLDLRLDNFVITPDGVGFVDFGSAVRVGEKLSQSPMLASLFDEMMTTSEIQQVLGKMMEAGRLTSALITGAHRKVDKAVDLFYLALQMRSPHLNPEFRNLVNFEPQSAEARRINLLTDAILRPADPARPNLISAKDVYSALQRIEQKLSGNPPRETSASAA